MRDRIAGAAVGVLAMWAVGKVTGLAQGKKSLQRTTLVSRMGWVLALGGGALYGARRTVDAVRRGQTFPVALLLTLGATAVMAVGRNA